MSGKRKPLLHSPKGSSNSSSDDDTGWSKNKGSLRDAVDIPSAAVLPRPGGKASPASDVYDNVASPDGSSTASGPVYVRPPGFEHYGQEIAVKSLLSGKGKKKKAVLSADALQLVPKNASLSFSKLSKGPAVNRTLAAASSSSLVADDSGLNAAVGHSKLRPKKEPLPMKLRALPQSFWQQPNLACDVSPGQIYAKLPPLISKDARVAEVDLGPPLNERGPLGTNSGRESEPPKEDKRIIRVSSTDWLYKLFDGLDGSPKIPTIRRGRPRKVVPAVYSQALRNDDPCMGNAEAEAVLPSLRHDRTRALPTLTMVSLRDRDKSVSLPALHMERNYSQLLSELVVKL